ncbi:MAG TPA: hypothetical protein VKG23_00840 [Thermoanaerobaculia bacterium]|nr:hypothetical protein [Thermoanaerobaculia bacterium]
MKRLVPALAILVVARMTFHALWLPAFEGPDEPHHLGRIVAFASEPFAEAFAGARVPAAVVAAVRAYPCAPVLAHAYGCGPFSERTGAFDLLRPGPPAAAAEAVPNPEANQPPLFYLAAGLPLRLATRGAGPAAVLLAMRLLSVALVALALFGPMRVATRGWSDEARAAGLLALLLPGASEALARASNDAAVFLWAACVVAVLIGRPRTGTVVLLLAAGPLLKLTAIPIVAFAVVALWWDGRRGAAAAGAAASLAVFPVQLLRGWRFGGTVELNRATAPIAEPGWHAAVGFARSAYAFVKTAFWVGGWSELRPPAWLAAAYFVLLIAAVLASRRATPPTRLSAHRVGLAVAAAGFIVFAVANRRLYGDWGGVAGWYLWDWSPWLATAAADLIRVRPRAVPPLVAAAAVFAAVSNAAWLAAHVRFYGG